MWTRSYKNCTIPAPMRQRLARSGSDRWGSRVFGRVRRRCSTMVDRLREYRFFASPNNTQQTNTKTCMWNITVLSCCSEQRGQHAPHHHGRELLREFRPGNRRLRILRKPRKPSGPRRKPSRRAAVTPKLVCLFLRTRTLTWPWTIRVTVVCCRYRRTNSRRSLCESQYRLLSNPFFDCSCEFPKFVMRDPLVRIIAFFLITNNNKETPQ